MKIGYTTILHEVRLSLGLNMNEYALLDLVYRLSTNPKAPITGWCNMPKQKIADFLGLDKRTIMRICNRLFDGGFLEKSNNGQLIKTTDLWVENAVNFDVTRGGKLSPQGGQTVTPKGANCHPSIYKEENNIKNNRERESALFFLKSNFESRYQIEFEMRLKSKIKNLEKFKADFNDTVTLEKLEFEQNVLFARLSKYARNWIENQDKFKSGRDTIISDHERMTSPNNRNAI